MKKLVPVLSLLIVALSASAGRDNIFSRLTRGDKATSTTSVSTNQKKADAVFESVNKSYSQGKISADSVINMALYHKIWNPELAARCLALVAADGNPRGVTELGVLYAFTPALAGHVADGVKLLEEAAKGGYNDANDYLAFYYFNQKDYNKARSYLEACHPINYGFANTVQGSMYLEGKGVREDGVKARESYRQGALKGYPRGMSLYASLLGTKNGGPIDYPDAFFWHYIAGDLGENYSRTMLYLPRIQEEASGNEVHRDAQTALTWIEAVHSGKSLKNEPIYKDGFIPGLKVRERAAEQGDDWSRYYLGSMNYNGDFLNQNYTQVLHYYEPIAKNAKLPHALLAVVNERLAKMYREGKGVKADQTKAARYARAAAHYGSLPAYKLVENVK